MLVYLLLKSNEEVSSVFNDFELAKKFLLEKTFSGEFEQWYLRPMEITDNQCERPKEYEDFSFIPNGDNIFSTFVTENICNKIYNEYPITDTLDKLNILINCYIKIMNYYEVKKNNLYQVPGTGLFILELETQQDNLDINLSRDIKNLL